MWEREKAESARRATRLCYLRQGCDSSMTSRLHDPSCAWRPLGRVCRVWGGGGCFPSHSECSSTLFIYFAEGSLPNAPSNETQIQPTKSVRDFKWGFRAYTTYKLFRDGDACSEHQVSSMDNLNQPCSKYGPCHLA